MTTHSSWATIKKHSRKLTASSLRSSFGGSSPQKEIKFTKFNDSSVPITLNLDGTELTFDNHMWKLTSPAGGTAANNNINDVANNQMSGANNQALLEQNRLLLDENQTLKYKIEVLLDMVSLFEMKSMTLKRY